MAETNEQADDTQVASVNAREQINSQTKKNKIATSSLKASRVEMERFSGSYSGDASTVEFANKRSSKQQCCLVNHVEFLQTLGNYTFATHSNQVKFYKKLSEC